MPKNCRLEAGVTLLISQPDAEQGAGGFGVGDFDESGVGLGEAFDQRQS